MKTIVADDEDMICHVLTAMFERSGHKVITATTAEQAIAAFDREPDTDLVLTDFQMGPTGTGLDVCRHVRATSTGTRSCLMSGKLSPDVIKEASALGVSTLAKPFTPRELHEAIGF